MRFERVGRELVYDGRILRVFRDKVRVDPGDGSPARQLELEHIEHPGAACDVPFLDDGRVVLIRQFRYSAGGVIWELPAGKLDGGEPPEACARRELEEETGWVAGRLERLATLIMTPGFCDERIAVFAARELRRGMAHVDSDELLTVAEVGLEEALAMVRDGRIADAKTVAGLLLAADHARRQERER
jgi:ADP-ribose pyrophosphatase